MISLTVTHAGLSVQGLVMVRSTFKYLRLLDNISSCKNPKESHMDHNSQPYTPYILAVTDHEVTSVL